MRLSYYQFPAGAPDSVRLDNGCAVVLKDGGEIWPDCIPDNLRPQIDHVSDTLGPMPAASATKLLRRYGGRAYACK